MPPERSRKNVVGKPKKSKTPKPKLSSPPIYKDLFGRADNPTPNFYSCPSFTIPKIKRRRNSHQAHFEKKSILAPPCIDPQIQYQTGRDSDTETHLQLLKCPNGAHFDKTHNGGRTVDDDNSSVDEDSDKTVVPSQSKAKCNKTHRHQPTSQSKSESSLENWKYDSIGCGLHFRGASPGLEKTEASSGYNTERGKRKNNGDDMDDGDVLMIGLTQEEMNEFY